MIHLMMHVQPPLAAAVQWNLYYLMDTLGPENVRYKRGVLSTEVDLHM